FWNSTFVKRSDDVTRLQALVDRKKIVISEDVIHEILQLDDAEGVVCLPNEEIFAGLAQMGYEKLSTKLTFYKAFFSNQWKFLIHTFLQSLSAKRTSWNEFSTAMASAVFANMRRVGKGFSGVETPLFEGMLAARQLSEERIAEEQVQADVAVDVAAAVQDNVTEDNLEHDKAAQKLEIIKLKARVKRLERANKVKSSKLRRLRKVGASMRIESSNDIDDVFNQGRMIDDLDKDEGIRLVKDADIAETEGRHAAEYAEKQAEIYQLDLDHPSKVLSMQEDDSEVQEVVEVVTTAKLITDVVTAASQDSTVSATISATKPSIHVTAPIVVAAYTRGEKDAASATISAAKLSIPAAALTGKGILIKTPKPMKKKDQIKLDAEYARKLHEEINKVHEEINKDTDWDAAINHVKQKSKENPP
nr:hypothetical protein [Tanacetum cinerariifolium]